MSESKMALRQIIEVAAAALAGEDDEEGTEMEGAEVEDEGMTEEADDVREKALQIQALRDGRPHAGTPMQGMHRAK